MAVTLKLDYEQLKSLVDQLDINEKEKLNEYLINKTLKKRYDTLGEKMKNFPFTPEDIQEEIKKVRSERYK